MATSKNIKVSIVIPLYNQEKYIGKAIESCLYQDSNPMEIIVVDDGSTDSSTKIVHDYIVKYPGMIFYYKIAHVGYPSKARNLGIKKAKGKYIALLDGDDLLEPYWLMKGIDFLETNHQISLLCGNATKVDDKGKGEQLYFPITKSAPLTFIEILKQNKIITSTVILRKKVFETVGLFDEDELFYYGDYELWLRLLAFGKKSYYLNIPASLYRINYQGISYSHSTGKDVRRKKINTFRVLLKSRIPWIYRWLIQFNLLRFYLYR